MESDEIIGSGVHRVDQRVFLPLVLLQNTVVDPWCRISQRSDAVHP